MDKQKDVHKNRDKERDVLLSSGKYMVQCFSLCVSITRNKMIHTVEGILFSDEASRAGVKGGVEVRG